MAITCKTYSIPNELTASPNVSAEETANISSQLRSSSCKLIKEMREIDRKEKRGLQNPRLRNTKV